MKILINDRSYNNFDFYDQDNAKNNDLKINPIESKLFHEDIFSYHQLTNEIDITSSNIRDSKFICGVLILDTNKTYGRTSNKKRLLYKCIPDNKHLPFFLVPYDIDIGFIKKKQNKFILFQFHKWDQTSVHPLGIITETLGDVDNLEAFYEYQLYSKSLNYNFKELKKRIRDLPCEEIIMLEKKEIKKPFIFTIDPANSVDFDDGISFEKKDNQICITIYLANVFMLIESLNLWGFISDRVSSIYLPNCKKPMLPTILSENLCSLKQDKIRHAFEIKFYFDYNGLPLLKKTKMQATNICVDKNFVYEENQLFTNLYYKNLFDFTLQLDKSVANSRELIQFWMIHTNTFCSEYMMQHKMGIFRTSQYLRSITLPMHIDEVVNGKNDLIHINDKETRNVLQNWNNCSGQYIMYDENACFTHEVMGISNNYCHITSPIRRIVDLINQTMIHIKLFPDSKFIGANNFLCKWTRRIAFINSSTKSIRKIQNECKLLNLCFKNDDIMNIKHKGILFDRNFNQENNSYTYAVYLIDLKMISKIKSDLFILDNTEREFKIFLFKNEENTKKKIKLALLHFD
jgi:exoribonuclease R